jgi:exopolysaccharide production protein ExoQ
MPPFVALFVWFIFVLGLLRFDPARERRTSLALWVPLIWIFFDGSRLPSQWLGSQVGMTPSQALQEGSALDRIILGLLILLAILILISRHFRWGGFFARNVVLMSLVFFALVSVLWSDFPFVSFKRWIRDLGNYLVILVVLSDPHPLEAFRTLLRRLFYLLIPLSILLIKYFPQAGRLYDWWSGGVMFVGATTSKNMLGVACLVSGIYFFWDTVTRWPDRKVRRTKRVIFLNVVFLGMTLWLLSLANSATSRVCLVLGCLVIAATHTRAIKRNPRFIKALIPACFIVYLILAYGFGINGQLAAGVGRDATLTGRTNIWKAVLSTNTNPLVGVGYDSFWLGPRLTHMWQVVGLVNEAHNGYLEVYINLGLVGVFLLLLFLIASFKSIGRGLTTRSGLAPLGLALWTIILFYNMTESAAFNGQFLWENFLLVVIFASAHTQVARDASPVKESVAGEFPSGLREGVAAMPN